MITGTLTFVRVHSVVYVAEWAELTTWITTPARSPAEWVTDNATIPHEPDDPGWIPAPEVPWLAAYKFHDDPALPYSNHFIFAWMLSQFRGARGELGRLLISFGDCLFWADPDPDIRAAFGADAWHLLRPNEVAALTAVWFRLAPRIEEFRTLFDDDFDWLRTMFVDWGAVLEWANQRGWAVFFRGVPLRAAETDPP